MLEEQKPTSPYPLLKGELASEKGALLLEILIVTAILVVILSFSAQLFLTSARSNKSTKESDVAQGLADETLEAVRGVAGENWLTIYNPPDTTGTPDTSKGASKKYHPVQQATKWAIATSSENINVDGLTFTRYFTIDNVNRDSGGNIVATGGSDDPSTQKITIYVTWPNGTPITTSEYITRWRNKVCVQSDWSGGATSGTSTCSTNVYGSVSNIDASTAGSLKLISQ